MWSAGVGVVVFVVCVIAVIADVIAYLHVDWSMHCDALHDGERSGKQVQYTCKRLQPHPDPEGFFNSSPFRYWHVDPVTDEFWRYDDQGTFMRAAMLAREAGQ